MKKKNIYITGSGGYLGQQIVKKFLGSKDFNLYLSFEDVRTFSSNFYIKNADVIIHLVAKHPSFAGTNEEMNATNYHSTKFLFDNMKDDCHFIFLSTDHVFKNDPEKKYYVDSSREPSTTYGITKMKSEDYILKKSKKFCIIRTSMLYGAKDNKRDNFINYLFNNLKNEKKVELYSNVWCRPTNVLDLVEFIDHIIKESKTGIFHASGKQYMNRYEIGKKICSYYNFKQSLLVPALKPKNSYYQSINLVPSKEFEKFNKRDINS